jgi:hypothetical protein
MDGSKADGGAKAQGEPGWSLDRRVPVVLLATILIQTGVALVWAGEAHERFVHLERQVERQAALSDRTVRVEERLSALTAGLERIEAKLDRAGGCAKDGK